MIQEVISAVRRLVTAPLLRSLESKNPGSLRQALHPIEDDKLDVRKFDEKLWFMYDLTGEVVLDELLKECQTQPGSRSEMYR